VNVLGGNTPSTTEESFWGGKHAFATPKDLSNLGSPILLETERGLTSAGVEKVSSGVLPVNTVLMSSRAPIGYVAISKTPVSINQGFAAMVCERDIGPIFAYFWTLFSMDEIKSQASGSTFAEISKSTFRKIPIVKPRSELCRAYERVGGPIFERIEESQRESQTLAALRDLLLPKLMSGEICVKDAEKCVGEAGA
jgi:type I restriction enzyme, S subunit